MKRAFPILFALLAIVAGELIAFPPRAKMQQAVQDFGFKSVKLTGFAFLGCSEHDAFRQKWIGQNGAGQPVRGVVCGGLTKGWTVRLT